MPPGSKVRPLERGQGISVLGTKRSEDAGLGGGRRGGGQGEGETIDDKGDKSLASIKGGGGAGLF